MKKIQIKQNNNAELFRKLESIGCQRIKITRGGRGEYSATGTTGKQGRTTYQYPNCLHDKVVNANVAHCASPKTVKFL